MIVLATTNIVEKIILFIPTAEISYSKYEDLFLDERVEVHRIMPIITNRVLSTIRKVHLSSRINNLMKLPFKQVWHTGLDDVMWEKDVRYHVVFFSDCFRALPLSVWKKLRGAYSVVFSTFLQNGINSYRYQRNHMREAIMEFEREVGFRYIFTNHPADAREYGYIYCDYDYSVMDSGDVDIGNDKYVDLYLINNVQDRYNTFVNVYEVLRNNDVKCKYSMVGVDKKRQVYADEIEYNKRIPYKEVVANIQKCNCILEVLGKGQSGASCHYYEAVCYNKKLLTDNKDVVNMPFYNPEYIHVFDRPEDIDCNWIKERIHVDYGYDGRFSPTHLIDKIMELEEQKEAQGGGKEK